MLLTTKNSKNCVFHGQSLFLCIFKNTDQKNICASNVLKAESILKCEEKTFET